MSDEEELGIHIDYDKKQLGGHCRHRSRKEWRAFWGAAPRVAVSYAEGTNVRPEGTTAADPTPELPTASDTDVTPPPETTLVSLVHYLPRCPPATRCSQGPGARRLDFWIRARKRGSQGQGGA